MIHSGFLFTITFLVFYRTTKNAERICAFRKRGTEINRLETAFDNESKTPNLERGEKHRKNSANDTK